MLTLVSFIVGLGLLITVHEYGHYRTAVACGVAVQRFGIATFPVNPPEPGKASALHRFFYFITKPVWEWQPRRQHKGQNTVFAVGLFPLAGYIQMLGQNGDKDPPAAGVASDFRNKPVLQRMAIVAAGPLANLLLAVVLYAGVNWYGVEEARPVLGATISGSYAHKAGLLGGEKVESGAFDGEALEPIQTFEEVRWLLTRGALDGRDVRFAVDRDGKKTETVLRLSTLRASNADEKLFREVGIMGPLALAAIGEVKDGGAAQRAGLKKGDVVLSIGGQEVIDGQQLRELIRSSVADGKGVAKSWQVRRDGKVLTLEVQPVPAVDAGRTVGRIEAFVGAPPAMVTVRHGVLEGLWKGVVRTAEMSAFTLRMMGKMLTGQLSLKNLSGPITIAEYAGKSADVGLTYYLLYLAVLSVSLGVLNLLPVPVLDGGHLMYYLWEGLTGKSVSDAWMDYLQRGGTVVLLAMISVALFNDFARQISRFFG